MTLNIPLLLDSRCALITRIGPGKTSTFHCEQGSMAGRFVNILIPGNRKTLTLCEVEVYGAPEGKCLAHIVSDVGKTFTRSPCALLHLLSLYCSFCLFQRHLFEMWPWRSPSSGRSRPAITIPPLLSTGAETSFLPIAALLSISNNGGRLTY